MHPFTLAGFQDELEKIATNEDVVESGISRAGAVRIEDEKNNPDWRMKGAEPALQNQQPKSETPASKANAFFGLPLGRPRRRNVRDYDFGNSAAQSPDRSQQPIDAQSTANISQGGAQYPAAGPGGV